ncbi:MAG TPA: GNAT family N-acetyltransferase [Actinomycetaceae bacterium]|nr:GNAT family N-acetyltransferase [Actinomycetaceae bacterium]
MSIETVDVIDRGDFEEVWRIRFEVFVEEQQVPIEEEIDARDRDPATLHALAFLDGEPAGTGRVLPDGVPGHVHVGRVAVRRHARGSGVGAAVMAHLEGAALAQYGVLSDDGRLAVKIALAAQETAVGFYTRLGYEVVSPKRYLDAGIWHRDMARVIAV